MRELQSIVVVPMPPKRMSYWFKGMHTPVRAWLAHTDGRRVFFDIAALPDEHAPWTPGGFVACKRMQSTRVDVPDETWHAHGTHAALWIERADGWRCGTLFELADPAVVTNPAGLSDLLKEADA